MPFLETNSYQPTGTKKPNPPWLVLMLVLLLIILLVWAARCQKLPESNQLPEFNNQTEPTVNDNLINNPTTNNQTGNTPTLSCQTSANGYTTQRIQGLIQLDDASLLKFLTAKLIDGNQALRDIQGLTCLEKLTIFNDGTNNITDLAPLSKLIRLQVLEVDGTNATDPSPLNKLTNLKNLLFANSPITNLVGIKNLTNLTSLNLSGDNRLADISALRNLVKLTFLGLSGTKIIDLSPITSLKSLKTLSLANTNWSEQVLAGVNPFADPAWQSKLVYPPEIEALFTANPTLSINWLSF